MYDFALTTENPAVAKEWQRLEGSVFQRQRRFVRDPGAVAWLKRSRSYAWFREVRLQTSGLASIKCYEKQWTTRGQGAEVTPTGSESASTAAMQLCQSLRASMTPGIEMDAASNWLDMQKHRLELAGTKGETAAVQRTVCEEIELILDYYSRPRWFFNEGLRAAFKELLGPIVYRDAAKSDGDRRKAAVRLGYALWFFGPTALLNERARETFLTLGSYPADFGLCLVLASGILDPGSGRPPGSPDSPESKTQSRIQERKRLYHAAYAFVCDGTDPGKRARARRILEEKGCLGALKRLEDGVSEAEAEDYALKIVVKTERGLSRKNLKKLIDHDPDFSL